MAATEGDFDRLKELLLPCVQEHRNLCEHRRMRCDRSYPCVGVDDVMDIVAHWLENLGKDA